MSSGEFAPVELTPVEYASLRDELRTDRAVLEHFDRLAISAGFAGANVSVWLV